MEQEQDVPSGEARHDERPHPGAGQAVGSGLAMPEEDDPAGEGHMFTPGPDWPPARPDADTGEGSRNDVIETSKPLDEP